MIDRIPDRVIRQVQRDLQAQEERVRQNFTENGQESEVKVVLAYLAGKKQMLECLVGGSKEGLAPEEVISKLLSQARSTERDLQSKVSAIIQDSKTSQIRYWTESARQYVAGLTLLATENWARLLGAHQMQDRLGVSKDKNGLTLDDSSRGLCNRVRTAVNKVLGEFIPK